MNRVKIKNGVHLGCDNFAEACTTTLVGEKGYKSYNICKITCPSGAIQIKEVESCLHPLM